MLNVQTPIVVMYSLEQKRGIFMKQERDRPEPTIIDEINQSLRDEALKDVKIPTVESIAEKIGVNKKTLYGWLENDKEFRKTLGMLKEVQANDPFKDGSEMDLYVDASMIALVIME